MPRFQGTKPKRAGACLLLALAFGFCPGCGREGPEEAGSASKPSTAPASFALPRLSDAARQGLPATLQTRITSAYDEASASPDDPGPLGGLAALYFVHGFLAEAVQCFERAGELRPDEMPWWYCAGLAYEEAGQPQQAIAAFKRALAFGRDYPPLYVHLADLILAEDPAQAATLYQQALDSSPTNALAHYGLGRVAAAEGRQDEALKHFRRAVGFVPEYADAHRAAAEILDAIGRQEEAQTHLRRAEAGSGAPQLVDPVAWKLRWRGLDPEVLCSEAVRLAQQSQFERAEALVRQALQLGNAGTLPRLTLAALRALQRRPDEAMAEYQAVLEVEPDSLSAKSALAQAYADTGQTEQAERLLREALAQRPDHLATIQRFAALMNRLGKPDEPLRVLQQALEADRENETLHFRLAQLLASVNRDPEAVEHLRQALELRPEFLAARHMLALGLQGIGDVAGARAEWEQVLQTNPKLLDGYMRLAGLAHQQRDIRAAERVLRQGVEHFPEAHDLANTLAWFLATSSDPNQRNGAEAVQLAEKACALTEHRHHVYLDTLAAAYAEVGRFEDAVRVERQAVELATAAQASDRARKYSSRLALYQWNQPYHEPE